MSEVYIDMRKENEWIRKYFTKDLVSIDDLLNVIEELDSEVNDWKIKYSELQTDLQDNYKPISHYEEYGISESDFH